MTVPASEVTYTPAAAVRAITGLAGIASLFSGLYGAWAGYGKEWQFFGFEVVAAVAGASAVLFAIGRVRQAHAMALACIAGTLFVCAVLGYVPIRLGLEGLGVKSIVWAAVRVGMAGIFAALAVLISILPNRAATRTLARALLWALPLALVAGWYRYLGLAPLRGGQSGFLEVLRVVAVFIVAVGCGVCFCAFVHCAIRAFEIAFPERSEA